MGRSQDVNKYLNNASTRAVDITQADFKPQTESDVNFKAEYLGLFGENKRIMKECVVSALKHMFKVSNSNLMRNADSLLATMD